MFARSSFKRLHATMDRDQRLEERATRMANLVEIQRAAPPVARGVIERVVGPACAQPRDPEPVRSEAYRRLVAARPCINCGVQGYSQAAHPPATARGKKEDDRLCAPLCGPRLRIEGCHFAFDQCKLVPGHARRTQMEEWAGKTRRAIEREGLWPKNLPKWPEGRSS